VGSSALLVVCSLLAAAIALADVPLEKSGESLYDFYCYQCHGYNGDGRTLAASYLDPPPRDFASADPAVMTRSVMLAALEHGRPGTAMTSFARVIDRAASERIVDFIRTELMRPAPATRRYHTAENGWASHDRFAAAYPFATGGISLGTDPADLSPVERQGRLLYLGACISCHDHGRQDETSLFWNLRPLSYPRAHYSHRAGYTITGASPYAVHDQRPAHRPLTPVEAAGQTLFETNCAFCHAVDGTARNWIGSFMEPHPRDLTRIRVSESDAAALAWRIARGLPGTSMPAWKDVLSGEEIDQIVAYVTNVLASQPSTPAERPEETQPPVKLSWRRHPP
jgi:cytochrome c oxidase cbb3-type subunit 3